MSRRRVILGYVVILALGLAPVLVALGAGSVATMLGCRLDEGQVHPCSLGPVEIGGLLYQLGVLGWLGLVTIPLGLIGLALFTGYLIITRIRKQ